MRSPLAARLTHRLESIWYAGERTAWSLAPLAPLAPLEGLYRLLTAARRQAYRRGLRPVTTLPVPVVVVGNVSVGGTGKTPCVIWLASELLRRGWRPGVISRGYAGRSRHWPRWVDGETDAREVGDEPVLIARRARCPVVVAPDRVAAARHLLERAEVDVLIADDGLQHYALGRRMELAVVDGARGLGNGRCLPAGPLREPAGRLDEVDAVIVNGPGWSRPGAFRAALEPNRVYRVGAAADAAAADGDPGEGTELAALRGQRVHAVAGIGHPQRFFDLLRGAGLEVIPHPLPDHAVLEPDMLRFSEPGMILVTEKDAVKCRSFTHEVMSHEVTAHEVTAHDEVWCVAVDLRFEGDDGERLMRQVLDKLTQPSGTTGGHESVANTGAVSRDRP